MTGVRWTAGGLLLSGFLAVRGVRFPSRESWRAHALLGVLLIGLGTGAVVWAEQTVPSGLTALLIAVTPFWMMAVERLTDLRSGPAKAGPHVRLARANVGSGFSRIPKALASRKIAGLVVGFVGVMLLVWPQFQSTRNAGFLAGVLATQVAAVGWSVGSNLSRLRSPAEDLLAAAAIQMIFGGLFMLALSLLFGESPGGPFSARSLLATLYLLFIGSIVAYTAYAYALRHLPLTTVSLYAYVTPVIAVVLGTVVLNEPFSGRILVASAIVLVSVGIVRYESVPS
jgi:drug/metabolite transporter (DMT)-like permease